MCHTKQSLAVLYSLLLVHSYLYVVFVLFDSYDTPASFGRVWPIKLLMHN